MGEHETHETAANLEECTDDVARRASAPTPPDGVAARVAQALAQSRGGVRDAWEGAVDVVDENEVVALRSRFAEAPREEEPYRELVRLYEAGARWSELCELHLARFGAIEDATERSAVLRALAQLLRVRFGDDQGAFEVLLEALRLHPSDDAIAADVAELARATDRFGEVLVAIDDWLRDASLNDDVQRALRLRIGLWYGEELGKPSWALPYLEAARAGAPRDPNVLRALVRVHVAAGTIGATEPMLRALLEIDPRDAEALDGYVRILLGRGAIYDLVGFLEERVRDRDASLNPVRLRLSSLHCMLPGGDARARELLEQAWEHAPEDAVVLDALDARCVATKAWSRLLDVLEAKLDRATSRNERIDVLVRLASVWDEHLRDADRAASCLEQVVEIDPRRDEIWTELQRCYATMHLWDAVVYACERHIDATADRSMKIATGCAMARVLLDELDVPERALEALEAVRAVDPERLETLEAMARVRARLGDGAAVRALHREMLTIDPAHVGALASLREVAMKEGDVGEAARLLEREQRHTSSPKARARLLVELAKLRRDRLGDDRGAEHAFAEAYALDPDDDDAAWGLAEAHLERSDVSAVMPLLERLARNADARSPEEQQRLFGTLGRARALQGNLGAALPAFRRAARLPCGERGVGELDVLRGLVEAAIAEGEIEEAVVAQQRLVATLPEHDRELRVAELHRLGVLHARTSDARRARHAFERVLELDPTHRSALSALLDLEVASESWDVVAELEEQLLDVTTDAEERRRVLRKSASRWAVRHPARAAEMAESCLAIDPNDRRLLRELLQLRELLGDPCAIVDVHERFVACEPDGSLRAAHLFASARIVRDDLHDPQRAIELLERALEEDPSAVAAFRALDELMARDESSRERLYVAMVSRARRTSDASLEHELWQELGAMRQSRGDVEGSLQAFREASRLRPDDSQGRQLVAALYDATDRTDLAVAELREAIARDPLDPAPHHALHAIWSRTGEIDRALCAASVLVFLKGATTEQRTIWMELRPKGVPQFRAALSRGMFQRALVHRDLDADLSALFGAVVRGARAAKARALNAAGRLPSLIDAAREEPDAPTRTAAKAFFGAANVLGIDPPQLWVRERAPSGLTALPVEPPASVMGAAVLSGCTLPELMFVLGKHLVGQHGPHAVRAMFRSSTELQLLRDVALAVARPTGKGPKDVLRSADALRSELRPDELEALGRAAAAPNVASANVERWLRASELSGVRAGFLLGGDLSLAAKVLRQEPQAAGDASPNEKIKELVRFAVSDDYQALRRSLGIDVGMHDLPDDDEPTVERRCA